MQNLRGGSNQHDIAIIFGFIIIIATLFGCGNNMIYYNEDHQAIVSCDNYRIKKLYVTENDSSLYLIKTIEGSESEKIYFLYKDNNGYEVQHIIGSFKIKVDFKIKPNSTYSFENSSFGDATGMQIKIETDSKGNVKKADKKRCSR